MKDNQLYKIQRRFSDGVWQDSTTTGVDGHEAWLRLHGRVKNGEIDPREKGWRLVPTDLTGKAELPWEEADKPVCPNCGQWQHPRGSSVDCVNDCVERGFVTPNGIMREEKKGN